MLVVQLDSVDDVLGQDFLTKYYVDLHPSKCKLSFMTPGGRQFLQAHSSTAELPACDSSFIESCSVSSFAKSISTVPEEELTEAFVACVTAEIHMMSTESEHP